MSPTLSFRMLFLLLFPELRCPKRASADSTAVQRQRQAPSTILLGSAGIASHVTLLNLGGTRTPSTTRTLWLTVNIQPPVPYLTYLPAFMKCFGRYPIHHLRTSHERPSASTPARIIREH
ncbi:hypothetical protein F4780DRAFT_171837 [Xylariomycetidae sp. FL0641]|nr:hypothetical protein F4780DRAFT_171837 [Xylariomycetidae sp. FL0641]